MRALRVSRTPLREALKVMAAEGFVTLRPNRGAVVAPIDPGEIGPLVEFKGALERLIGLLAPERASDADIAELERLHLALKDALMRDEHASYTHLNFAFHQKLAQTTQNPVLVQSYEALQQKIWRYRFTINELSERLAQSYQEHERIMIALRARARLDLAERLEEHNRLTGEAMSRALAAVARAGQGAERPQTEEVGMSTFDTIIRGGRISTASDTFHCDIGIRHGRIAALGEDLGEAERVIDAQGKWVLPGGIDSHVHISQPSGEGIRMADDFEGATRSAALGGNTTVLSFCLQESGVPLRQSVQAYHAMAEGAF